MKASYKLVLVTFLLLAFIIISCSENCGDYPGNEGKDMGTYYVSLQNKVWFVDSIKTIYFINSNGLKAPFTIVHYGRKIEGFQTDLQMRYPKSKCGNEGRDYCKLFYDQVQYSSDVAGIYFTITREVNVPKTYPEDYTYNDLVNSPEIIKVSFSRNNYFNLVLNQDTISNYRPQIKLIDSTYYDVFELNKVQTSNEELYFNKVFYKKSKGILGFVLSNGEKWERY
jgi:hypothetical protein